MEAIEVFVSDFKLLNAGALKAFADVTYGDMTIKGCRVVQKDGQDPWVGFPQLTYQKNGKTVYKDVIEVPRALKKKIVDLVLDKHKKSLGEDPF